MLKKVIRFLKRNIHISIMPVLGAAWGLSISVILSGQLSAMTVAIIQSVWALLAVVSLFGMFVYYYKSLDYRNTLNDAIQVIEQISGYRQELVDKVAIYSKMAHSGVSAPIANTVASFVQSLEDDSTVFLIRVSHDEGAWYLHMAGQPVHINQVLFIMDMMKHKVSNIASDKGFIFKKRDGVVN